MTIKGLEVRTVECSNGSVDVETVPYEEEVEDLGREHLMCNICGFNGYPECMGWCKAYLPNGGADAK